MIKTIENRKQESARWGLSYSMIRIVDGRRYAYALHINPFELGRYGRSFVAHAVRRARHDLRAMIEEETFHRRRKEASHAASGC